MPNARINPSILSADFANLAASSNESTPPTRSTWTSWTTTSFPI